MLRKADKEEARPGAESEADPGETEHVPRIGGEVPRRGAVKREPGARGSGRCRPIAAFVVSFGQVRSRLDSHERDEDQGKPQPIESRTGVDRYGGSDDGGGARSYKQDRLGSPGRVAPL